ncbi:MAG: flagellar biosynthesis protein FlhF [Christensenellales bacterium]
MFVKKYITKNMAEAMEKIRRELGSDTLILNSRSVRRKGFAGFFKKKLLEVVVAYESLTGKNDNPGQTKKASSEVKNMPGASRITISQDLEKIDQLNIQISELQNVVRDFTEKMKISDKETIFQFPPEIITLYNKLAEQDVNEELAKDIAYKTQEIAKKNEENPVTILKHLIMEGLGEPARIKLKKYHTNVIVFVGPTGVGKTTTLVKLASMYALQEHLKVGLINADTYRVAAQEQLKTYADIIGIPLFTIYNPEEMGDALKAMEDRDVILIDTAGKSSSDKNYHKDIEAYLLQSAADEVLMTLSIATGFHACKEIIRNYSFMKDYKIILTKTDEVSAWGNILNVINFAGKPLVYITTGQNVPDDIEQADVLKIADHILGSV